ncbi:MAG: hypothetical protein JO013_03595 [Alphaproteobacteria bacterium]|nr:hypothetical protein [Alphaproteobacteria bacterium]
MSKASVFFALGAAALAAGAALADAPGQHSLSLRNGTGGRIDCGMHKDGSSVVDVVTLKAGQVWTQSYAGDKRRWLRCEGVYSQWQRLEPDGAYELVKAAGAQIVARPAGR